MTLESNKITDIEPLRNLRLLQYLFLNNNRLDNDDLPDLYNLVCLSLAGNPGITSGKALQKLGDNLGKLSCEDLGWDGTCEIDPNSAPSTSIISLNPDTAMIGEEITLKVKVTDNDSNQVQVKVDWGEGIIYSYSPLQRSDSLFTSTHVYLTANVYNLKAKAKDEHGIESDWTKSYSVVAYEDSLFTYSAEASDPENKSVQITFRNYPSWLKPDKHQISGTPRENTADTTFMVLASDGMASDSQIVIVKFISVNDPPQIVDLADITIGQSELYIIPLNQHVTDEDHVPSVMTWQVNSLNPKLTIEQNQHLVSIQGTSELDTTTVQFKVTDPGGLWDERNIKVTILHRSGIASNDNGIPGTFTLEQNYPNPFNPETSIRIGLPEAAFITVKVFDVQGRLIADRWSGKKSAGYHQIAWQTQDVPTGLYLIKLEGDGVLLTRKCLLVK